MTMNYCHICGAVLDDDGLCPTRKDPTHYKACPHSRDNLNCEVLTRFASERDAANVGYGKIKAELATANKVIDGFQGEMTRQAKVIVAQGEVIEALTYESGTLATFANVLAGQGFFTRNATMNFRAMLERTKAAKAKLEEAQRGN